MALGNFDLINLAWTLFQIRDKQNKTVARIT